MENKLTVTINETELPIKEYNGQRVVTLKEIDTVHSRPEGTSRKRFNDNKKHFIEGTDYFVRNPDEAAKEFGITAPNGLTLITESGYLMLVKSFTDDLAWAVQRQLVNTYFRATTAQRKDAAKQTRQQTRPSLSAVTAAMKLQVGVAQAAGMDPAYIQIAMAKAFEPYGCDIPANCLPEAEQLYECEEIARELGVMSEKGLPHNKAVAMLIRMIGVDENEKKMLPFSTNAYSNVTVKYKRSVLEKVRHWLEEHNYPSSFRGLDGKNQHLYYKKED